MSVLQRRLASSTYALMRSFERRIEKLEGMIDDLRNGRLTEGQLTQGQAAARPAQTTSKTRSIAEPPTRTPLATVTASRTRRSRTGPSAVPWRSTWPSSKRSRLKVEELLGKARNLMTAGQESKSRSSERCSATPVTQTKSSSSSLSTATRLTSLVRRLEGLGFTGQVASIHGGMDYRERERQVEFFRRPASDCGASYLVATDAAGEGINLQFCWLMVNYDIPWNPARLEQRMAASTCTARPTIRSSSSTWSRRTHARAG